LCSPERLWALGDAPRRAAFAAAVRSAAGRLRERAREPAGVHALALGDGPLLALLAGACPGVASVQAVQARGALPAEQARTRDQTDSCISCDRLHLLRARQTLR
jgi:hypothetical protein